MVRGKKGERKRKRTIIIIIIRRRNGAKTIILPNKPTRFREQQIPLRLCDTLLRLKV